MDRVKEFLDLKRELASVLSFHSELSGQRWTLDSLMGSLVEDYTIEDYEHVKNTLSANKQHLIKRISKGNPLRFSIELQVWYSKNTDNILFDKVKKAINKLTKEEVEFLNISPYLLHITSF